MKWIHLNNQFQHKFIILSVVMFAVKLKPKNLRSYLIHFFDPFSLYWTRAKVSCFLSIYQDGKIPNKWHQVPKWTIVMYWNALRFIMMVSIHCDAKNSANIDNYNRFSIQRFSCGQHASEQSIAITLFLVSNSRTIVQGYN